MSQRNRSNGLIRWIRHVLSDDGFVDGVEKVQVIVAKVLSIAMLIVIFEAVWDLTLTISASFLNSDFAYFKKTLFEIFGLFLNVLITLEILENITAYLRKHVFQVELVIATSLIAVARKIIILDLEKTSGLDIIGLASAVFALSISYWWMRCVARK
ncbi:phosphate-starvation-inducible PsiE family protein [Baaleninema sp.]|uniref:phosphate-starvation-inducible PsiE family protein n=1 Tax=Baaleninema sp. TaxID=3101197 RepID=UPI003D05FBFD